MRTIGSVPVPDPTVLTTEALNREIASLEKIISTRLAGMDKALALFQENITRVPTDTDKQISHLKELVLERFETMDERFRSIQTQFIERDVRVEQTARDTKVAVDAALQAAEKAVGKQNEASSLSIAKSEAATNKQIDQLGQLISTTSAGTNGKIDDIKERVLRLEGEGAGKVNADNTRQTSSTFSLGVVGLIIASVIGAAGLVVTLFKFSH